MKIFLFLLILTASFLIPNSICFSQNRQIDSLTILLKTDKADTIKVNDLNHLSHEFYSISNYEQALYYAQEAKELASKLNFTKGLGILYNTIGDIYWYKGNLTLSTDNYFNALKIFEKLNDKKYIADCNRNVGWVYFDDGNYGKAFNYYNASLAINQKLNRKKDIAGNYSDLGILFYFQKNNTKALDYYFKALKIEEELGLKEGIAGAFVNISNIYKDQNEFSKSLDYLFKSLKISKGIDNKTGIAYAFGNIGIVYGKTGKFKEAEQYLKKAISLDDTIGNLENLMKSEDALSWLYETTGRFKLALIHFKKSIALKDTIFSQENKKQLIRKEMNYEFDKKETATKAEHDKEMAVAEAEKKKQKIIIWSVIAGLLLVIVFAGFVFRSLRITRRQKNIIELQKNEVDKQKEIVEKQKEKIVDSITYAQRIQQSILMEESEIQKYLPECFIYFQPKDIVSGDFYWCSKVNDKIIIAAVDCTGHGVPGAFMSMIGNTLLNQIVNEKHITKPSEILHYLNLGVYEALHQKKDGALSDDGMDTAVCCIDYKNNELQYAGQNSLYILSDGKIEVIKGDIYGIGGGGMIAKLHDPLKKVFANHVIPMKESMSIYLSTDGFMDQFGGSDRKKFGAQKFKDLLLSNQHLNMQKQKELISSAYAEWKGKTVQIDDVLVIGIRI